MSQQRTILSSFLPLDPPQYELPLSSSIARSGFSGWAFMKSLLFSCSFLGWSAPGLVSTAALACVELTLSSLGQLHCSL